MCLAEFAANYVTSYRNDDDDGSNDVLPSNDDDVEAHDSISKITLTDNFGVMHKRAREAVIRFARFNKDKEPSNYYRAKLMLYYPWRNKDVDIIADCETYEERYNDMFNVVYDNECKYSEDPDVDDVEYDENGPPEHLWAQIAPNNENNRLNDLQDDEVILSKNQDDIDDNTALITNVSNQSSILQRYESSTNHDVIEPE